MNEMKRIGVLTSGGDAPGMNAAIRAVVRTCAHNKIECLGIQRGYNGLINGDIIPMDAGTVNGIVNRGGTILYTARCMEFFQEEGVKRAADTCRYLGISGLVVIGGDGTFKGGLQLSKHGVPVVGIPATIDNDICCSQYTIGFDTACNTAVDSIDKLRDTMQSHERCSIVEVMGRHAGHLAMYVAIACGAMAVLVPELPYSFEADVAEKIRSSRIQGRTHHLIIVAEGVGNINELSERIRVETGMEPRITILGHIQRGGSPSARDRVTATRMGQYAVQTLLDGRTDRVVVMKDSEIIDLDINEGLSMERGLQQSMIDTATIMTHT